jgi:hypothetical protein
MDDFLDFGMRDARRLAAQDQNRCYRIVVDTFMQYAFAYHARNASDDYV